jgi:hypothetical protein
LLFKLPHSPFPPLLRWLVDCHAWAFAIGEQMYDLPMHDVWGTAPRIIHAGWVRLRDVLRPPKTVIKCTYDFGDCWELG